MARIRTIKPEFCSSDDTGALSRDARLFFLQLLTEADDEGRLLWLPRRLCGVLYPHDEDVGGPELARWAAECSDRGMVCLYAIDGVKYLQITNWDKHQRINRATPSKLPPPPVVNGHADVPEDSGTTHGGISEVVHRERNREGEQGRGTGNREQGPLPGVDAADAASADPAPGKAKKTQGTSAKPSEDDRVIAIILDEYHKTLPACRRIVAMTPKRRKAILAANKLARDLCKQQDLQATTREFWGAYFDECAEDPWLAGTEPNAKNARWKQHLFCITDQERFGQVMDRALATMATGAEA